MPLLIDGHNLIGKLSGLRLDDPQDEPKLVSLLRTYCARTRRHAIVVFDHGLPGGWSQVLSGGSVDVVFAATGRTADGILCERIREARNPRGLVVISSDRAVSAVARARGARVVRSEDFAAQLSASLTAAEGQDVRLSPEEVEEWLQVFGEGDDQT